jgi:MFS family permease
VLEALTRLSGVRRLVVVICAIVFLDALLFGALIPLVPGYVEAFDLSKLQAGLLVGAFGAGAILGGIPGGILAGRVGPKNAVVAGLVLLAVATFGLALAGSPETVGIARFLQGISSALTWAGALSWLTVSTSRALRGQLLGTVFGIAVLGAILGPMLGALAQIAGIRAGFTGIGVVALALAAAALAQARPRVERVEPGALRRAIADPAFVAGLWLNTLPALFFGVLDVLAPLALHAGGYGAVAIATVFLVAGLIETALNPLLGRLSDRRGRLLPIRWALSASIGVGILLAFAQGPLLIAVLAVAAAVSFGGFYTPGIALVSDRAELAGLAQGLAFGVMNTAWAIGALIGPTIGGGLADALGDAAPYLLCSLLCAVTLAAIVRRLGPKRPLTS